MSNLNEEKIKKVLTPPPAFTTNSLTNYKYVDGNKSEPRLSDADVSCAKKWVDDNEK